VAPFFAAALAQDWRHGILLWLALSGAAVLLEALRTGLAGRG
jgi:hypothetical protein